MSNTKAFSALLREALRAAWARNTWTVTTPSAPNTNAAPNVNAGAGTQAPQPAAPSAHDIMNSLIRGRRR